MSAPPSSSERLTLAASPAERRTLFPAIEAYKTGMLKVSDIHTLYWEESGNPEGKPVIVLHGGPGGGVEPFYRTFFDPAVWRIVMFDQRGAGRSTPSACLVDNTTWTLVDDVERIRKEVGGIDKWVVFGGSWGSTLSIAYGQTYPQQCKALVLRGIFTLRASELLFFYQEGANHLFPEAWEIFIAPIPPAERGHLMSAYQRRLTGDNEEEKLACARAWSMWEKKTSRLYVDNKDVEKAGANAKWCLAFARIENHFFVNAGWFKYDGQLIAEAGDKLKDIPGVIVQGRYDVVCPAKSAWELHKQWKESELHFIEDAGHSCKEDGIIDGLLRAVQKFETL
jgi:proline iminopeptidase